MGSAAARAACPATARLGSVTRRQAPANRAADSAATHLEQRAAPAVPMRWSALKTSVMARAPARTLLRRWPRPVMMVRPAPITTAVMATEPALVPPSSAQMGRVSAGRRGPATALRSALRCTLGPVLAAMMATFALTATVATASAGVRAPATRAMTTTSAPLIPAMGLEAAQTLCWRPRAWRPPAEPPCRGRT